MLFLLRKIKKDDDEKSNGEEQRFWENMLLMRFESRRGNGEKGEVKKVKTNLVEVMK